MTTLDVILDTTRATLAALRTRRASLEREAAGSPPPPPFLGGLGATVGVVAEVKRRSPSSGAINEALDPVVLARAYVEGGAAAISVLTDGPFFGGSLADLAAVTAAVPLPVLRKDFILDEVQLLEARAAGASSALLIVRALAQGELQRLLAAGRALGLRPLVEVHTSEECRRALDAGADLVGINARDLDTFAVDCRRAWELFRLIPAGVTAVAESGMASVADVGAAAEAGADAVLVGSALAASAEPSATVRAFAGVGRYGR
jgi:indole-3-glycerol phosphate synthase